MYPEQAATEDPMMAKAAIGSAQLRRPISSANIAKEKKAIDEVIGLLQVSMDELEIALAQHGSRLGVVSSSAPFETDDSRGFEYMGSSPVYDQLHSLLARTANTAEVVRTLTRRLEV
jgi:hypothetical protein